MHVISSPMEEKRRNDLAASRAEEYAPRPTGGLFMAGVAGAGLLLAADAIISGFYGWRLRDNLESLAGLMAAGSRAGLRCFCVWKRRTSEHGETSGRKSIATRTPSRSNTGEVAPA